MTHLLQKLRIQPGTRIAAINANPHYKITLGKLPARVSITNELKGKSDFIHLFVKTQAELDKEIKKIIPALNPGALLWISYPKGTSGIQTDLTRDKGWDSIMNLDMEWLSLISFDEKWSAFLMKNTPKKGPSKASSEYQKHVARYIDAASKTITLPDDLKAAFRKNAQAAKIFEAHNFTNRKEYVLWVVSAKREETRKERVTRTIEKLLAGKKNPADK